MQAEADALERECAVFVRYLVDGEADDYLKATYVRMAGTQRVVDRVDRKLLDFAAAGPLHARIADAYARIFRPHGQLRRRLVLICAILESSRPFHRRFTAGTTTGAIGAAVGLALSCAGFGLCLLAGIARFGPNALLGRAEREEPGDE